MMAVDPRLQRLLGGDALASLRLRLRQRFARERGAAALTGFRIANLTVVERAALASLQGTAATASSSMRVDVAAIDDALKRAAVAGSLREALVLLDGPIIDRAAERCASEIQWQVVVDAARQGSLATLLQSAQGVSVLRRISNQNHAVAARLIASAEAVLNRLPARGIARAQLAAETLGDAHGLDKGCAVATLVLEALRAALTPNNAPEIERVDNAQLGPRELWASTGVLVNELARPALVLNLSGVGALGEPAYLSLRFLLRSPPLWAVRGVTVFVCENPNLLLIAADRLGARCAPLVCTEGMPAAAQATLLRQLVAAGALLHYHGDFDWPGLHIGNYLLREFAATPWCFGVADYEAALAAAPALGRALKGAPVAASWDEALTESMRRAQRAVDEEMVADGLCRSLECAVTTLASTL
jgi:uncharacterized protein (TIGR02679 family)